MLLLALAGRLHGPPPPKAAAAKILRQGVRPPGRPKLIGFAGAPERVMWRKTSAVRWARAAGGSTAGMASLGTSGR